MNLYQCDPYISSNLRSPSAMRHLPNYRKPVFCAIIGRFSEGANDVEVTHDFLSSQLSSWKKNSDYEFFPELIVAGANNIMCTSFMQEAETKPTIFHLYEREVSGYQIIKKPDLSFAIFFTHLMAAVDFIRLGKMPWEEILNNGKID